MRLTIRDLTTTRRERGPSLDPAKAAAPAPRPSLARVARGFVEGVRRGIPPARLTPRRTLDKNLSPARDCLPLGATGFGRNSLSSRRFIVLQRGSARSSAGGTRKTQCVHRFSLGRGTSFRAACRLKPCADALLGHERHASFHLALSRCPSLPLSSSVSLATVCTCTRASRSLPAQQTCRQNVRRSA